MSTTKEDTRAKIKRELKNVSATDKIKQLYRAVAVRAADQDDFDVTLKSLNRLVDSKKKEVRVAIYEEMIGEDGDVTVKAHINPDFQLDGCFCTLYVQFNNPDNPNTKYANTFEVQTYGEGDTPYKSASRARDTLTPIIDNVPRGTIPEKTLYEIKSKLHDFLDMMFKAASVDPHYWRER